MGLKPLTKSKECKHGKHVFSYCEDCCREMVEYNRKLEGLAVFGISEETLELAELVANMPPMPNDKKSIEEWAKRLAADISKGRD